MEEGLRWRGRLKLPCHPTALHVTTKEHRLFTTSRSPCGWCAWLRTSPLPTGHRWSWCWSPTAWTWTPTLIALAYRYRCTVEFLLFADEMYLGLSAICSARVRMGGGSANYLYSADCQLALQFVGGRNSTKTQWLGKYGRSAYPYRSLAAQTGTTQKLSRTVLPPSPERGPRSGGHWHGRSPRSSASSNEQGR